MIAPAIPRRLRVAGALLLVATIVAACSGGQPLIGGAPAPSVTLTVYAASSLKAMLGEAGSLLLNESGEILSISTDSSAALEAKIEQGAPADVFLSADTSNPQKLIDGGFAVGPAQPFARNVLLIILAPGNPAKITSPFDLGRKGVKVIAAGDTVPITTYATQLVHNLAGLPGAPAGFEAAYAANVVTKVENVAAIVTQIQLGQGDAAIVYVTDAKAATIRDTLAITPESANVTATYSGVVLKASTQATAAQAFLTWLVGPQGQAVLPTYGFLPPPT